jgi:transcriptional regulator
VAELDILQGTVSTLVLKALSWGPQHGFAVSRFIRERSGGELGLEDAGLYQALHRLERHGLVSSTWGTSEHQRRARFYRLTPAGRRALEREIVSWRRYVDAFARVIDAQAVTA